MAERYEAIVEQVEMLSYEDRLHLLGRIIRTLDTDLHYNQNTEFSEGFDSAFGLWKDTDITLSSVRQKAWGRSV